MHRLTIRKEIAGIIIPGAMTAGLIIGLAASAGHVFALDGTFFVTQLNDTLDRETYRQSYTMSYSQSDVLEEGKTVMLSMALDDDFIAEELTIGNWDGYDGSFTVTGYMDSEEVFSETADGGSVIDLTGYGAADEIRIESEGEAESTAGFAGTSVDGHVSDSFSDESLYSYFYYYVSSDEEESDDDGSPSDFILAASQLMEMEGFHYAVGTPLNEVSATTLDHGSTARLTASGISLSGDEGMNYFRTYIYVPYGTEVSTVTMPEFENASVLLYVDGEPVEELEGIAQINAAVSEMYLEIIPSGTDTAQLSDLYVDFTNTAGTGETGEAYVKSVVNFGRNVSKYAEGQHIGVTLLPMEQDDPDTGDTGENPGDTGEPSGPSTEPSEPSTEPSEPSQDPDTIPGGNPGTGSSGAGSSGGQGNSGNSSQGTSDNTASDTVSGTVTITEPVISDLTGLGLGGAVMITADSSNAAVSVSRPASLPSSADRNGYPSSRVEVAEVEDIDPVSDTMEPDVLEDNIVENQDDTMTDGTGTDDAEENGNEEDNRESILGRIFSGNIFRIVAIGAAAAAVIVILYLVLKRKNKYYD